MVALKRLEHWQAERQITVPLGKRCIIRAVCCTICMVVAGSCVLDFIHIEMPRIDVNFTLHTGD